MRETVEGEDLDRNELRAKANAWNAKINKLVNGMHFDDLEAWQIALLLMAAASGVGRHGGVPLEQFLSHFRECVAQEYGITICAIAVEEPTPGDARLLKFPKRGDA